MKMTRREEQYDQEEDELPKAKAPPEATERGKKIKEGIKSPIRNTKRTIKTNSRKISNS